MMMMMITKVVVVVVMAVLNTCRWLAGCCSCGVLDYSVRGAIYQQTLSSLPTS